MLAVRCEIFALAMKFVCVAIFRNQPDAEKLVTSVGSGQVHESLLQVMRPTLVGPVFAGVAKLAVKKGLKTV